MLRSAFSGTPSLELRRAMWGGGGYLVLVWGGGERVNKGRYG
jgi:hypothetical protein